MPKSLLAIQNDRRSSERRQVGSERRSLPDRRQKSVEVNEDRRRKQRRILEQRRMQERRMHNFQTNILNKDVLEKEEHALIISSGLDEEETQDHLPKYEKIYENELAKGFTDSDINTTIVGLTIVGIAIATFILYQFVFI